MTCAVRSGTTLADANPKLLDQISLQIASGLPHLASPETGIRPWSVWPIYM